MAGLDLSFEIYQGDTGPVIRPRPSILADGVTLDGSWVCESTVLDANGNTVIDKRTITTKTTDQLRWVAALTPDETSLLPTDSTKPYTQYVWVLQVTNPTLTPPFRIEKHITLQVKEQGLV